MLVADVAVTRGDFDLAVGLEVAAGTVTGLVGPNGSGKTTVLRALAGLLPLATGDVTVSGQLYEDPARHVRLPAQQRRTGVVFQERLLFPHLTVRDNVAFGPRRRGARRRAARAHAQAWLDRTGLAEVAERRPHELSGGQQQRVAIARALASGPQLLLLDEPLAAVDAAATTELRQFLRRHLTEFTGVTVLVTHEPLDALVLCDDVVVLDRGRAVQTGAPTEVARRPRSAHVAALMGLNLLRGHGEGHAVRLPDGERLVVAHAVAGDVFATFRPSAVTVHTSAPRASARNVWPGSIAGVTPHGDVVRLHIDGLVPVVADITPDALTALRLRSGDPVWTAVKAVEVTTYPA